MGEYAKILGHGDVKLGTCEALYFATLPQLLAYREKGALSSFLDPRNGYQYRFPFPDEKSIDIGDFKDYDRGYLLRVPDTYQIEIAHGTMFIRTDQLTEMGKLITAPALGFRVPCIVGPDALEGMEVFDWQHSRKHTTFEVVRQKLVKVDDRLELQVIVRCPYCGEMCRLSREEVMELTRWKNDRAVTPDPLPEIACEIIDLILKGYTETIKL